MPCNIPKAHNISVLGTNFRLHYLNTPQSSKYLKIFRENHRTLICYHHNCFWVVWTNLFKELHLIRYKNVKRRIWSFKIIIEKTMSEILFPFYFLWKSTSMEWLFLPLVVLCTNVSGTMLLRNCSSCNKCICT